MYAKQKILCPLDFGHVSFQALLDAMTLMAQDDTEFILLQVIPGFPATPAAPTSLETTLPCRQNAECIEAEKTIANMVRHSAPPHLKARVSVRQGEATSEILRAAVIENVDLILVTAPATSGRDETARSEIANAIMRLAPCPVITTYDIAQNNGHADSMPTNAGHIPHQHHKCEAEFPYGGSPAARLRFLLQYAILAPSNRNSQPWLWKLNGDAVELYADRIRALPYLDPDDRELILSCGASLQHLCIAIRHFGYEAQVETFPDPDDPNLLARVLLGKESQPFRHEEQLFEATSRRHTNRHPFQEREIHNLQLGRLQMEAVREGARLIIIESAETRTALIDLIANSDSIQGRDTKFLQETAQWIHPNLDPHNDGIPEYALGARAPKLHGNQIFSDIQAHKVRWLAHSAPVLAVIETSHDSPHDWLAAGQALSRVLLRACFYGIQASFFNSPVEIVEMWPQLHRILSCDGLPQILLRLGYPLQQAGPTPRRAVNEVIQSPIGANRNSETALQ